MITFNIDKNFAVYAQKNTNNPCPQTMTMGATYVDKQGCIQPCPTSITQGQIPERCPKQQEKLQSQPQQQLQSQSLIPPQPQEQNQKIPVPNDNLLNITSCPSDLSGVWQANDGGTYYIKQIDNTVYWFGSNVFNGNAKDIRFTNDAKGHVLNGTIHVAWMDTLFLSDTRGAGQLTLNVDASNSKLVKVGSQQDFFGASEWNRKCIP